MKVLLVNGSPHEKGCTYTALREAADELERNGVEAEIIHLGAKPVPGCIACGSCRSAGKCFQEDMVNYVLENADSYDGYVFGSPVYYGGPSGQLTSFMDRLFFSGSQKFAGKPGAAVVSCRRGGASAAFEMINKYMGMTNMPIVTSQYWNQVHGSTPEDVRQDLEGLQTMRTLAKNMAWLIKCIAAGEKEGIRLPEYETPVKTNFIR